MLFYDSGDLFIISLSFLQTTEFDHIWKKISDGAIKMEDIIKINNSLNNNYSGNIFSSVKDVSNLRIIIFYLKYKSFDLSNFATCFRPQTSFLNSSDDNKKFKLSWRNLFEFVKTKNSNSISNNNKNKYNKLTSNLSNTTSGKSKNIINNNNNEDTLSLFSQYFTNTNNINTNSQQSYSNTNNTSNAKGNSLILTQTTLNIWTDYSSEKTNNLVNTNNTINYKYHNTNSFNLSNHNESSLLDISSQTILLVTYQNYVVFINITSPSNINLEKLVKFNSNILSIMVIDSKFDYQYLVVETENDYQQLILHDSSKSLNILDLEKSGIFPIELNQFSCFCLLTKQLLNNNEVIVCYNRDSLVVDVYLVDELKKSLFSIDLKLLGYGYNNDSDCEFEEGVYLKQVVGCYFYDRVLICIANYYNNESKDSKENNKEYQYTTKIEIFQSALPIPTICHQETHIIKDLNNTSINWSNKNFSFFLTKNKSKLYSYSLNPKEHGVLKSIQNITKNTIPESLEASIVKKKLMLAEKLKLQHKQFIYLLNIQNSKTISSVKFNSININLLIKKLTLMEFNYTNLRNMELFNFSLNNLILDKGNEVWNNIKKNEFTKSVMFGLLYLCEFSLNNLIVNIIEVLVKQCEKCDGRIKVYDRYETKNNGDNDGNIYNSDSQIDNGFGDNQDSSSNDCLKHIDEKNKANCLLKITYEYILNNLIIEEDISNSSINSDINRRKIFPGIANSTVVSKINNYLKINALEIKGSSYISSLYFALTCDLILNYNYSPGNINKIYNTLNELFQVEINTDKIKYYIDNKNGSNDNRNENDSNDSTNKKEVGNTVINRNIYNTGSSGVSNNYTNKKNLLDTISVFSLEKLDYSYSIINNNNDDDDNDIKKLKNKDKSLISNDEDNDVVIMNSQKSFDLNTKLTHNDDIIKIEDQIDTIKTNLNINLIGNNNSNINISYHCNTNKPTSSIQVKLNININDYISKSSHIERIYEFIFSNQYEKLSHEVFFNKEFFDIIDNSDNINSNSSNIPNNPSIPSFKLSLFFDSRMFFKTQILTNSNLSNSNKIILSLLEVLNNNINHDTEENCNSNVLILKSKKLINFYSEYSNNNATDIEINSFCNSINNSSNISSISNDSSDKAFYHCFILNLIKDHYEKSKIKVLSGKISIDKNRNDGEYGINKDNKQNLNKDDNTDIFSLLNIISYFDNLFNQKLSDINDNRTNRKSLFDIEFKKFIKDKLGFSIKNSNINNNNDNNNINDNITNNIIDVIYFNVNTINSLFVIIKSKFTKYTLNPTYFNSLIKKIVNNNWIIDNRDHERYYFINNNSFLSILFLLIGFNLLLINDYLKKCCLSLSNSSYKVKENILYYVIKNICNSSISAQFISNINDILDDILQNISNNKIIKSYFGCYREELEELLKELNEIKKEISNNKCRSITPISSIIEYADKEQLDKNNNSCNNKDNDSISFTDKSEIKRLVNTYFYRNSKISSMKDNDNIDDGDRDEITKLLENNSCLSLSYFKSFISNRTNNLNQEIKTKYDIIDIIRDTSNKKNSNELDNNMIKERLISLISASSFNNTDN